MNWKTALFSDELLLSQLDKLNKASDKMRLLPHPH